MTAGGFRFLIAIGSENEPSILLRMTEKDLMYPIGPYPEVRELSVMLERLLCPAMSGAVSTSMRIPSKKRRKSRFGSTFVVTATASRSDSLWRSGSGLKGLFSKVLALPGMRKLLEELSLAYGEL